MPETSAVVAGKRNVDQYGGLRTVNNHISCISLNERLKSVKTIQIPTHIFVVEVALVRI